MKDHPKMIAVNGKEIAKLRESAERGITDINSLCAQLTTARTDENSEEAYLFATTEEKINRLKKFIAQLQELTELW